MVKVHSSSSKRLKAYFYFQNALALRKGMLPYCRWFAKADLKWQLPIFGLSMWVRRPSPPSSPTRNRLNTGRGQLLGMIMVKRDWLKDSESTRQAFLDLKKPEGKGKKIWLVTFLEGTRKTDKKLAEASCLLFSRSIQVLRPRDVA